MSAFPDWAAFTPEKAAEELPRLLDEAEAAVAAIESAAPAKYEDFIWALDDMFNALMALPNLIALICLSGTIVKLTKNYYDRKKGLDVEPMLSAYPERNAELIAELEAEKVEQ